MNFPARLFALALFLFVPVGFAQAQPAASFAERFNNHLVTLDNGTLKPFNASELKDVKYFAFYYSASWCPPCRIFTPKLVDFYNSFKPKHPDFELIFVCQDNSSDDMLAYMKKDKMKWPAVRYNDIESTKANQFAADSIPNLVLLDASGKVLANNIQGSDFVPPDKVIDDIKNIVH